MYHRCGIRSGLVVTKPGFPSVSLQVLVGFPSGLACLSLVLLQLKDPFELFVKRREFVTGSGFLSCRNIT